MALESRKTSKQNEANKSVMEFMANNGDYIEQERQKLAKIQQERGKGLSTIGKLDQGIRKHINNHQKLYSTLLFIGGITGGYYALENGLQKQDNCDRIAHQKILDLQAERQANEKESGNYLPEGVTKEDIEEASREYDPEGYAVIKAAEKYRDSLIEAEEAAAEAEGNYYNIGNEREEDLQEVEAAIDDEGIQKTASK